MEVHTCWAPPHSLGSGWLVSKVFQRFLYYPKEKILKITKQNTRKPLSHAAQAPSIPRASPLENPLPLQVGVCVVATEALGVLAHVAALWTGLG